MESICENALDTFNNLIICILIFTFLKGSSHRIIGSYTVKKVNDFPVPNRDVTNKLSLARNNLIIPGRGEFGK